MTDSLPVAPPGNPLLAGVGQGPFEVTVSRVRFSPSGGATDAVVEALQSAVKTVLVQAYTFTSAPIAQALLACSRRQVDVPLILDRSNLGERCSERENPPGVAPRITGELKFIHFVVAFLEDSDKNGAVGVCTISNGSNVPVLKCAPASRLRKLLL